MTWTLTFHTAQRTCQNIWIKESKSNFNLAPMHWAKSLDSCWIFAQRKPNAAKTKSPAPAANHSVILYLPPVEFSSSQIPLFSLLCSPFCSLFVFTLGNLGLLVLQRGDLSSHCNLSPLLQYLIKSVLCHLYKCMVSVCIFNF